MNERKLDREIKVALAAAQAAVQLIRDVAHPSSLTWKASHSHAREVVTDVDIAVNDRLIEMIAAEYPYDPIIGEESSHTPDGGLSDRVWLLDPIDGTRSFILAQPGYSVMISLIARGEPQLAVISDVRKDETVLAVKGDGVYVVTPDGLKQILPADRYPNRAIWNPYGPDSLKHCLTEKLKLDAVVEAESTGLRAIAAARGQGNLFVSLPGSAKIWDTAPAFIIMQLLGGRYTDLHGRELKYSATKTVHYDGAVATVGRDHQQVLNCINECIQ